MGKVVSPEEVLPMRVLAAIVLLSVVGCAHEPTAIDTEMRIEITLTSQNYLWVSQ